MARMLSPRDSASVQVVISSPGMRAHNGGAENAAILRGDDLDVAVRLALGLRAVVLVIGPAQHADRLVALARLRFGQADMRKFRVGERHPRDRSRRSPWRGRRNSAFRITIPA